MTSTVNVNTNPNVNQLNTKDEEQRKKLLKTITLYKDRNYIDETEEHGLRSLLISNDKDNFIPSVKALESMKKRLLAIRKEKLKEQSKAKKDARKRKGGGGGGGNDDASHNTHNTHNTNNITTRDSKYQYKVYDPRDIVDKLSYDETERLFTEMCVFAKLSFIQPPSCLHCVYKLSQMSNDSHGLDKTEIEKEKMRSKHCKNLVVWRRNANIEMHPNKLDGNLLIVSCSTAKAWMRGKSVQGLKWDPHAKKVI
jgi:hypothetical protein